MKYYQVVFNRPFISTHSNLGQLTYAAEQEICLGARIKAELGSSLLEAVVVEILCDLQYVKNLKDRGIKIKLIHSIIDEDALVYPDQIRLAKWMASYYLASWGECLFSILPSAKQERDVEFSEDIISHFEVISPPLNNEQQHCVQEIIEANTNLEIDMCYLYGITGSGKTEVFLTCIKEMLDRGKQCVFMIPEIALVLQCYPLFCSRFGSNNVAVLHSKLTKSQRLKEWNRIRLGSASVVLGVRSAVFAPVKNLGLIVIDEEHDQSYKSDRTPRYHARQIAMKRCKEHNAMLVMGSATPSLEVWAFKNNPRMKFLRLHTRVAGGTLPTIELVSLQHTAGCVSVPLQQQIIETLKNKKQVLLLINRRGFSHIFLCTHCGEIFMCPHCSVNLTFHKGTQEQYNNLQCHYCGYKSSIPDSCPKCNFVSLSVKGWGTQKVEQEIKHLFPDVEVARMDSDIIKDHKISQEILGDFYRRKTQILVGTQMLAKGINFPHLQLVSILFADSLLGLPDYRAEERAFSLITQVAGRAGRFFENGKVIIQAYGIENHIFNYIRNNQGQQFFEKELNHRRQYNLAPFRRVLRIVFRGINDNLVKGIADSFSEIITTNKIYRNSSCTIFGPAPCVIERLANNYRYHVLLTAKSQILLTTLCSEILHAGLKSKATAKKVYIEIDPDPVSIF